MTRAMLLALIIIAAFWLGAVAHESDMSRNFYKTGDAGAWFFDIKCKEVE